MLSLEKLKKATWQHFLTWSSMDWMQCDKVRDETIETWRHRASWLLRLVAKQCAPLWPLCTLPFGDHSGDLANWLPYPLYQPVFIRWVSSLYSTVYMYLFSKRLTLGWQRKTLTGDTGAYWRSHDKQSSKDPLIHIDPFPLLFAEMDSLTTAEPPQKPGHRDQSFGWGFKLFYVAHGEAYRDGFLYKNYRHFPDRSYRSHFHLKMSHGHGQRWLEFGSAVSGTRCVGGRSTAFVSGSDVRQGVRSIQWWLVSNGSENSTPKRMVHQNWSALSNYPS